MLNMTASRRDMRIGICGAGIGGLAASIAIARSGAKVTVLEAAPELGEIGAGIQMTPNVSRFLIKWGVADIIGENLVQCKLQKTFRGDGTLIQQTEIHPKTVREFGFPWWMVHRAHLHAGLAEAARRHGVTIHIDSRVTQIQHDSDPVEVVTHKNVTYTFDLLVGGDGVRSAVRDVVFPEAIPYPPTANAAYRVVIPYEKLFKEVPEAEELFGSKGVDSFVHPGRYIICYPISGGKDFNMVLSHMHSRKVYETETVNPEEARAMFQDYHPTIQKVLALITEIKRWPLMQLAPMKSWSSPRKNVVLMGDAAHAMVNHLAQGAATAMEDGAFLGRVLADVLRENVTLFEAIQIYERSRMPRAWLKQQASFVMGNMEFFTDEERIHGRDSSSLPSIDEGQANGYTTGPGANRWSWNLFGAPDTISHIAGYDADADADFAVLNYLQHKEEADPHTQLAPGVERKWTSTFLHPDRVGEIAKLRM